MDFSYPFVASTLSEGAPGVSSEAREGCAEAHGADAARRLPRGTRSSDRRSATAVMRPHRVSNARERVARQMRAARGKREAMKRTAQSTNNSQGRGAFWPTTA